MYLWRDSNLRMILNISIKMTADVSDEQAQGPRPGLFRQGETSRPDGEWERWGVALLITGLLHAAVVALFWLAPASVPAVQVKRVEEPELVFFSFPPPPAAAAPVHAPAAVKPAPVRRQARVRTPPPDTLRMPTLAPKPPEPIPEAPPEPAAPEPVAETAPVATESAGIEGSSGVIGGIVGGALDGRGGGLLGASGGQALELTQVARAPKVLEQTEPRYPRRARSEGITGLVVVRLIIGVDGRVEPEHTRVLRSIPALDEAAITAVNQWRFTPALGRQGRPVRVIVEVPVQFSLR